MTSACGSTLRTNHGVIKSPGHPGNYPHNRDCTWRIVASPGNRIRFTFGHLAMENHVNCSYDYVKVSFCHTCSIDYRLYVELCHIYHMYFIKF